MQDMQTVATKGNILMFRLQHLWRLTEEDIVCQHCTYINPPQSLACGMCSNPFVNLTSDASEVNDVPAIYPSNSDNVLIARVVDLGYDTSKSDQRSREAHLDRKRETIRGTC